MSDFVGQTGCMPPDENGDHLIHRQVRINQSFNVIAVFCDFEPEYLSHKNNAGETPLDIAKKVGNKRTIGMLQDKIAGLTDYKDGFLCELCQDRACGGDCQPSMYRGDGE